MAAAKGKNLSSLFAELSKFGQNGNHDRAVKTADRILQEAPTNQTAFHCKVVCLIYQQKFEEVLQVMGKNQKLAGPLVLEKAYAQYRLNRPQDALVTLSSEQTLSMDLKELKAQVLYRLERYEECYDLYRDIIKNSNDDYEDERETNFSAVVANLAAEGTTREMPTLRNHTYELCYNASCRSLAQGKVAEAQQHLQESEKLCREMLEEDAEEGGPSEEDIAEELGIIRVQQAYCLQLKGNEKSSLETYQATLRRRPADIGLVAVASNNAVAINRDQNVFDSKKKMKAATAEGVEHKLTSSQRDAILLNQTLVALHTNQNEQCRRLLATMETQGGGKDAALIQAALLAREKKISDAQKVLERYASSHPDELLAMNLATVQLLLAQGQIPDACKTLRALGPHTHKPGIVSALVTLYMHLSDLPAASEVLKEAVSWYQHNKGGPRSALTSMWRQAASFHLRSGEASLAAQSLEELRKTDPKNQHTLAQLVIAYAQCDPPRARQLSQELPPLTEQIQALDVNLLENISWTAGSKKKGGKDAATPKIGTPGSDLIQQKKKKKRKVHLPKNYNPNVDPDPERWLPRHERAGFKKKKDKRRGGDIGKGTQGAATGQSDQYDITKMAPQPKQQPQASHTSESAGPRWQQRKNKKKKK